MIRLRAVGMATAIVIMNTAPADAQAPQTDPDWPCVQRLVPTLAAGQMWQGPIMEVSAGPSFLEPALTPLPAELTDRATPAAAAVGKVEAALAAVPADQRADQLTRLFAVTLDDINAERGRMIAGIKRFARTQRGIAQRITRETARIEELSGDPAADAEVVELRAALAWSRRVYDDRQRSLRTLCEQPVLLEQRAFGLARGLARMLP